MKIKFTPPLLHGVSSFDKGRFSMKYYPEIVNYHSSVLGLLVYGALETGVTVGKYTFQETKPLCVPTIPAPHPSKASQITRNQSNLKRLLKWITEEDITVYKSCKSFLEWSAYVMSHVFHCQLQSYRCVLSMRERGSVDERIFYIPTYSCKEFFFFFKN